MAMNISPPSTPSSTPPPPLVDDDDDLPSLTLGTIFVPNGISENTINQLIEQGYNVQIRPHIPNASDIVQPQDEHVSAIVRDMMRQDI